MTHSDAVTTMVESSRVWRLSAFVLVVVAAVVVVVTIAGCEMHPTKSVSSTIGYGAGSWDVPALVEVTGTDPAVVPVCSDRGLGLAGESRT